MKRLGPFFIIINILASLQAQSATDFLVLRANVPLTVSIEKNEVDVDGAPKINLNSSSKQIQMQKSRSQNGKNYVVISHN